MKASLGLSLRPESAGQVEAAVAAALKGLGSAPPQAAVVAATAALGGRGLADAVGRAAECLAGVPFAGASSEGLLVADREIVGLPGLAVVALAGISGDVFHCEGLRGREAEAGDEIASQLLEAPDEGDLLVVFADSVNLDPGPLLAGLAGVAGGARVVGLGASELPGDGPRTWAEGDPVEGGLSGLRLRRAGSVPLAVSDGGRPVGEEMEITRARGHWVLGLDGSPALEVLEAAAGPSRRGLLAGIRRPQEGVAPGVRVLRNLTGFDPASGGFALAMPPEPGDRLGFLRLDSVAARENLAACLAGLGPGEPGLGLYFSCQSRGEVLFEHAGLESGYLARALCGAPLLGMMGPFQFAPDARGGPSLLHTYSGVLARIDAEGQA